MGRFIGIMALTTMIMVSIGGWITHVIICIQQELWFLLIAGAFVFPVGIIHGVGQWFGAW